MSVRTQGARKERVKAGAARSEEMEWGRYAERVAADGEVIWLTEALGGGGPLPELAAWKQRGGRLGGARSARQRPRLKRRVLVGFRV